MSKATSLISRNLFYISSIFKVNVNDMWNGNVKLIEHGNRECPWGNHYAGGVGFADDIYFFHLLIRVYI